MDDQTTAELLTGVCESCASDNHGACRAESLGDGCICPCVGTVECPTCGKSVPLFADADHVETGTSTGECCHWMWVDWWDGTRRFDMRQGQEASARSRAIRRTAPTSPRTDKVKSQGSSDE